MREIERFSGAFQQILRCSQQILLIEVVVNVNRTLSVVNELSSMIIPLSIVSKHWKSNVPRELVSEYSSDLVYKRVFEGKTECLRRTLYTFDKRSSQFSFL